MFWRLSCFALILSTQLSLAQEPAAAPANEKARKTFEEALDLEHKHRVPWALDSYKKANKQDGGHCVPCQRGIVRLGIYLRDWKAAGAASDQLIAEAQGNKESAMAQYSLGRLLLEEGVDRNKEELFVRAHEALTKALASYANFSDAIYVDGQALARLKRDDEAKARFEQFTKMRPASDLDRQRALRYVSQPELARARMAPPFWVDTSDGQHISLDDLQGKIVLLDFWATWCAPCREALPHMREIAKKFQGEPLVMLSISLDSDEKQWKEFIAKNEMTWPQYRDGGFTGLIATLFNIKSIPHTFTIDADGVLQDEHIGDAAIEGKIKKLIARAHDVAAQKTPQ